MGIRELRWLLFIPTALLSAVLVERIVNLVTSLLLRAGSFAELIGNTLAQGLSGFACLYVAAYVAPCNEKGVATGGSIFLAAVMAANLPSSANTSQLWSYAVFGIGWLLMAWQIARRDVVPGDS